MMALDFSGRQQLYVQLYDILFQDIISGVYALGDLIPSETELMRRYGVSRSTARKAMEMLSNNGLIAKHRGRGSEVIATRPAGSPSRVASYIRKTTSDVMTPCKRLIYARPEPAKGIVAERLEVPEGTELYTLCRVRYSGETPCYLEVIHIDATLVPGALERDFSLESWRSFLSLDCNLTWARATQRIHAVEASGEEAGMLDVRPGGALISIERCSYDQAGRPCEFVQSTYRSDMYYLEIQLDS